MFVAVVVGVLAEPVVVLAEVCWAWAGTQAARTRPVRIDAVRAKTVVFITTSSSLESSGWPALLPLESRMRATSGAVVQVRARICPAARARTADRAVEGLTEHFFL